MLCPVFFFCIYLFPRNPLCTKFTQNPSTRFPIFSAIPFIMTTQVHQDTCLLFMGQDNQHNDQMDDFFDLAIQYCKGQRLSFHDVFRVALCKVLARRPTRAQVVEAFRVRGYGYTDTKMKGYKGVLHNCAFVPAFAKTMQVPIGSAVPILHSKRVSKPVDRFQVETKTPKSRKKKASSMHVKKTIKKPTKKKAKKLPVSPMTKDEGEACFKPRINQAIGQLAKHYHAKTALVLDDPTSEYPMQTSKTLRQHVPNCHITALSCDTAILPYQLAFAKHNDEVVCDMSTRFLEVQATKQTPTTYDMVFLDYCDTPAPGKKYNWCRDVELLLDGLLSKKGMIHMTFSPRSFGQLITFVTHQLDNHLPKAQLVGSYEYRDTQNMVVFTLVRKGDWTTSCASKPISIGRAIIPHTGETVLVRGQDEVWKGIFSHMLTSRVWLIYSPEDKVNYAMDKDTVSKLSMTI